MAQKFNFGKGRFSYFSVASSALSPAARRTGVEWVWKPVMVLGRPAWPTTSTAWPTRTGMDRGFRFSSTVINILGCKQQSKKITVRINTPPENISVTAEEWSAQIRINLHGQNKDIENVMVFPQDDGLHIKASMQQSYNSSKCRSAGKREARFRY